MGYLEVHCEHAEGMLVWVLGRSGQGGRDFFWQDYEPRSHQAWNCS
jgi:hypothetical protein